MERERWHRVRDVFDAALEQPPEHRAEFLDQACGRDSDLRREVDSLLRSYDEAEQFMESPAFAVVPGEHTTRLPSLDPGEVLGHYEIVAPLARGGMGEVYIARDRHLDRQVAVKLLPARLSADKDRLRRFEQEARAASRLSHPNVCAVHDFGEAADGRRFMAMEYAEGETLRARLRRGRLPLSEALDITIQVASALDSAHRAGIVHRDIKPENLIIHPDGYVKVLDFGIAKLTEHQRPGTTLLTTAPGLVLGTAKYMSPEQARGKNVDQRTDIWSLGVVLWEMVTGQAPFEGDTQSDVIAAILERPVPVPSAKSLTPTVRFLLEKALAKKPEERYSSMHDMLVDLKRAASPPVASWRSSSRVVVYSAGAVLLVAAAVLLFAKWRAATGTSAQPNIQIRRLVSSGDVHGGSISPDGKYIGYLSRQNDKESIWIRQLASTSSVQIVPPAERRYIGGTFTPDGNYLYLVAYEKPNINIGVLFQVSVLGGPARRLISDIDTPISFSPDGKRFAFIRYDPAKSRSLLMVANADGTGEITLKESGESFSSPRWSPAGDQIAVISSSLETGISSSILLIGFDGREQKLGNDKWFQLGELVWLPDNSGLIATENSIRGRLLYQVWFVGYPGGKRRKVTNDLNSYHNLSVTADSRTLVATQDEQFSNICTEASARAGSARELTSGHRAEGMFGLEWTPDGSIVYGSDEGGSLDLWIMDGDGGNPHQLTRDPGIESQPSVTPDGTILFASDRGGPPQIWRMNVDGSDMRRLTEEPGLRPSASADGKSVLYNSVGQHPSVRRIPIDGGQSRSIVEGASDAVESPDGRLIAYRHWDTTQNRAHVAIAETKSGKQVKDFVDPDESGAPLRWTRDGTRIAYVSSKDGRANVWTITLSNLERAQMTKFNADWIPWFAFSRDGKRVAASCGQLTTDIVEVTGYK